MQYTNFCREASNYCYFVHLLHLTTCIAPPLTTLVHQNVLHVHLLGIVRFHWLMLYHCVLCVRTGVGIDWKSYKGVSRNSRTEAIAKYTTPNKHVLELPTSTQLRANWHTDSLDTVVLPSTGASRYHKCCIDGGSSPEYFGCTLVKSCGKEVERNGQLGRHTYRYIDLKVFYILLTVHLDMCV
jgi:hypothetical protein